MAVGGHTGGCGILEREAVRAGEEGVGDALAEFRQAALAEAEDTRRENGGA